MDDERRRVMIVEDHEVVGQGIKALLSPYFDILGPIRSGDEVLPALEREPADALVLDISMPGRNGLDLLPDITAHYPRMPVVMLTSSADLVIGRTALLLGAMGFLPKDSGVDELELALHTVFSGRKYLSPRLPLSGFRAAPDLETLPANWSQLTPRQLRVLRLIGDGKDSRAIADELGVSEHTVLFHRRALRKTLGLDSDSGVMRVAALFHVREELPGL